MKILPAKNARAALTARGNGCRPIWWEPLGLYCCDCEDNIHGCDQQSSVIDEQSCLHRHQGRVE